MRIGNVFSQFGRVAELVYTVNQRLDRVEEDIDQLRRELHELRLDFMRHETRIATLEEGRNTVKAEVRAIIAETVADLRVRFAEAQASQIPPPQPSTPRHRHRTRPQAVTLRPILFKMRPQRTIPTSFATPRM